MKNLIHATILLLIVSSLSFGQTSASVTATVNAVLSIQKDADLIFGNVVKGTPKTILSTEASAAAFTITGEPSTQTVLTVTFPSNLVNGTNNLPFTGQTPVYNSTQSQIGASAYSSLNGGTASTNESGNLYVYIGGSVSPAVDQASGNYSGTINVSVVYP